MQKIYRLNIVGVIGFVWLAALSIDGLAADNIYTGFFGNTALGGYDAVSYFEKGKAEKGNKDFRIEHAGVYWQFNSEEHLQKFSQNPQGYMPEYGGFCAWAVAEKKSRAPGDPEYWKIVEGKLYLNYDKNVQQKWLQDIDGYIKQGDKNWPLMLAE